MFRMLGVIVCKKVYDLIICPADVCTIDRLQCLRSWYRNSTEATLYPQLEVRNLDFLDTHQLRQRLSDNALKVRSRVQQVLDDMQPLQCHLQGHEHTPSIFCIRRALTDVGWLDSWLDPHAWLT